MANQRTNWRTRLAALLSQQLLRTRLRRAAVAASALLLVLVNLALSRPAITAGTQPVCGLHEHTHSASCYDAEGTLVCVVPEHVHDDVCFAPAESAPEEDAQSSIPAEDTETAQSSEPDAALVAASDEAEGSTDDGNANDDAQGSDEAAEDSSPTEEPPTEAPSTLVAVRDDYTVTVTFGSGACLAETTTLDAQEIPQDSDEYLALIEQSCAALGYADDAPNQAPLVARFFDIRLLDGEVEQEPSASVRVTITCDALDAAADEQVQAVHFAKEGTQVLAVDEVAPPEEAVLQATASETTYAFAQESFSVSGLVVRGTDVPTSAIPNGAQVAKKRSISELENGATYLVYAVLNSKPYAIGKDVYLREMVRTDDGNNIYPIDGGSIDQDWLWTIDRKNTGSDGVRANLYSVTEPALALYPRAEGGSALDYTSAKALIQPANNKDSEFHICNNDGTIGINTNGTSWVYASSTKKTLYLAEVPSESTHTATQVNQSELLEGYYVISRNNQPNASTTGIVTMDNFLGWHTHAYGVGANRIQDFLTSEIWYVTPNGDSNYTVRNLWSGERLSPLSEGQKDTLNIVWQGNNAAAYTITSAKGGQGLRFWDANRNSSWDSASNFFLYRVDDDGFYHAYYDMTLGGSAFYHYANSDFHTHVQYTLGETDGNGNRFHVLYLPTTDEVGTTGNSGAAKPYRFRLNGWWDVYGNQWYAPGAPVNVYGNAVFYPDWVPTSYDIGQDNSLSSKAVYMPAITTTLFDFNELFNLSSLVQLTNAQDNISATGHTEQWRDSLADNSFLFIYRDGHNQSLHNLNGADRAAWNQSNSNGNGDGNYNGTITPGILNRNPSLRSLLFDASTPVLGKTYVGADHNLYSYDPDTGYYYYDSNRNAASYNQGAGRFYVYDYTNLTDKSRMDNADTWKDDTDFLPLNYGNDTFSEGAGDVNYWFGMKTEFYFFLPNDATTDGTKNKSILSDPLSFRFSGDDDVWVLVDDQLVLDLGGVHGTVYGEIDFSKSTATTGNSGAIATYDLKNGNSVLLANKNAVSDDSIKTIGVDAANSGYATIDDVQVPRVTTTTPNVLRNLKAGNHKLTLLYLERGSSESNAAIYFNIAPVYQLDVNKVDATTGAAVSGAKFKVYTDAACTQEATNVVARRPTTYGTSAGYTDASGITHLDGLVANQEYYLKETVAPKGYRPLSGPVRLLISGNVITCTYLPTDANGNTSEEVIWSSQVEPQGTRFSSVYGGFSIRVPNSTGRELPAAGGMGATPFVTVGALLVVLGGAGLLARRQKARPTPSRAALGALLMAVVLGFPAVDRPAYAQEDAGTLSVSFPAEGMPFSLYHVANVTTRGASVQFEPTDEVTAFALDWDGAESSGSYDDIARALAASLVAANAKPQAQGIIQDGVLQFGPVAQGLYLVAGDSVSYDGYVWSALPTLASVPDVIGVTGNSDVVVRPKQSKVPMDEEGGTTSHQLVKQWIADQPQTRPQSLRVTLMHGAQTVRTVTLSADNNWSYAWNCEDDGVPWTAAEVDAGAGYTFLVETQDDRIVLKNTYHATGPVRPDGSPAASTGDRGATRVQIAACALTGMLMVAAGILGRRRHKFAIAAGCVLLAVGICALADGLGAEARARQAQEQAVTDLKRLLPARTPAVAASRKPMAVMAVNGYDLVGFLDLCDADAQVPVFADSPACVAVELDHVQLGQRVEYVDVNGCVRTFEVDHELAADEQPRNNLVLEAQGMTACLSYVCVPCD